MNKTSSARLHRDAINFDSLADVFSGKPAKAQSGKKLYFQNGKSGPEITTRKPGLWQRYNAKLVSIKGNVKLKLLNSLYMSARDKAEKDGPLTGKAKVLLSLLASEIDNLKMQGGSLRTSDTRKLANILTALKAARHDAAAQARQEAAPPTVEETATKLTQSCQTLRDIEIAASLPLSKCLSTSQKRQRAVAKVQLAALGKVRGDDLKLEINDADTSRVREEGRVKNESEIRGVAKLRKLVHAGQSALDIIGEVCTAMAKVSDKEDASPELFQKACASVVSTVNREVGRLNRLGQALMDIDTIAPDLPESLRRQLAEHGWQLMLLAKHILDDQFVSGESYRIAQLAATDVKAAMYQYRHGDNALAMQYADEVMAEPADPPVHRASPPMKKIPPSPLSPRSEEWEEIVDGIDAHSAAHGAPVPKPEVLQQPVAAKQPVVSNAVLIAEQRVRAAQAFLDNAIKANAEADIAAAKVALEEANQAWGKAQDEDLMVRFAQLRED